MHIKNLMQLYEEELFLIIIDEEELRNFTERLKNVPIDGYM
jgi:hypothetical protein